MTVGRICRRDVDLVDPDTTARVAAQRMAARNVGSLLVADGRRHVLGVVTDRDLALRVVGRGLDPHLTCVGEVMTPHPDTVSEETSVEDALAVMRSRGVRRLPVLGPGGELAGVVSVDDVLVLLAEEFGDLSRLIEHSSPRLMAHCQPWSDAP
ncbi:MAG TPA: CBS domain-containing protein [Planctomycetota bacterium]|jgi:CBS domain-containing protein|nr:CBS domain-containing protein [Planctomycetota bacterium]